MIHYVVCTCENTQIIAHTHTHTTNKLSLNNSHIHSTHRHTHTNTHTHTHTYTQAHIQTHTHTHIPYSAKFLRHTIFPDWRFQKCNGPRILLSSMWYSKISRSLIFEVQCLSTKNAIIMASKIWRYTVLTNPHRHTCTHTISSRKYRGKCASYIIGIFCSQ